MAQDTVLSVINYIAMAITAIGGAIIGVIAKSKHTSYTADKNNKSNKGKVITETFMPKPTQHQPVRHGKDDCIYGDTMPRLTDDVKELFRKVEDVRVSLAEVSTSTVNMSKTLEQILLDIRELRHSRKLA